MAEDRDSRLRTDRWGIDTGYIDTQNRWRPIPGRTRRRILDAMRIDASEQPELDVRVVQARSSIALSQPALLRLEDGTELRVAGSTPPDLPVGYHRLESKRKKPCLLIVAPSRCFLPSQSRSWGWTVQLYALRSRLSWGIGDFADLERLVSWSRESLGADLAIVNPLNAASPFATQQPSPYFPSTRLFRNPLYLRIENVPGAAELRTGLDRLVKAGRALNEDRTIDRDAIFRLKMEALERIWRRSKPGADFETFSAELGAPLRHWAVFCTLAEHFQAGWRQWPSGYRHPESAAVRRFAAEHESRVRFHQWVQWLLDRQLQRAASQVRLVQDLPIGFDSNGADAWIWQDQIASGIAVGAPPDEFNTLGQNWGLPPFIPYRLRASGYEPFRQTLRVLLRHGGGLRIDHAMGLFRLFWIPEGLGPAEGAYVRFRSEELLAILSLESQRAGAVIVGEDLGTVEPGVREELAQRRILSYRVLLFERSLPVRYPRCALAAVTTHDLPTIAGLWSGEDLELQRRLRLQPNEAGMLEMRQRLGAMTSSNDKTPIDEIVVRTHRLLARAPSVLVTATLEDALAVKERPNMPGTVTENPNWSIALPVSLERLQRHRLVRRVAETIRKERHR